MTIKPHVYDLGDAPVLDGTFGTNVTDMVLSSVTGATTITVRDVTGYSVGSAVVVDAEGDNAEFRTVSNVSGMVITLSSALHLPHKVIPTATVFRYPKVWKLADPTTVALEVRSPDEVEPTVYTYALAEITKVSTGRYSKQITLDAVGLWRYGYIVTGNVISAAQGELEVTPWRV